MTADTLAPRRLKIGFPYAGDRFGGSNVSSLCLAAALRDRGHGIVAITHGEGRAANEARERGLDVLTLAPLSSKPGYSRSDRFRLDHLGALPQALSAIRRQRLDIVHTNDLGMLRAWALPALASGTPLVSHWRTALAPGLSVSACLRAASAIVAISQHARQALPAWAKEKAVVEHNPVDSFVGHERRRELKARVRERLALPPDAVLVGIFGTLIRRKRAHVLADILAALPATADGRPVFGLICGERAEPLDKLLFQKIKANGLSSRVIFAGFVKPVEEWMAACDLVVAPAVQEAFGRTPIEAFASGTPALISADCGAVELIQPSDRDIIVVPPEPVEGWIRAATALLNDPARMEDIARRAAAGIRRLSPQEHAGRIEAIYAGLRARRRRELSGVSDAHAR